ncbi:MAG: hypothetical protein WCF22_15065 [Candidatus Sulfotelmatobacter sp.]
MREEFGGLNPVDSIFDDVSEFFPLLLGDRGSQILDFDLPFPHEYYLGHFRDSRYPRIADELRIQTQQSIWFVRVATGRGLPLQKTAIAIQLPDGIDIGNEVVASGKPLFHLDLQIAMWLPNADAIILAEAGKQHEALFEHAVPIVPRPKSIAARLSFSFQPSR